MVACFGVGGAVTLPDLGRGALAVAALAAIRAQLIFVVEFPILSSSCLLRRYWLRAASAPWFSRRRSADLLPASFASINWNTSSRVISWFLSPSKSSWISPQDHYETKVEKWRNDIASRSSNIYQDQLTIQPMATAEPNKAQTSTVATSRYFVNKNQRNASKLIPRLVNLKVVDFFKVWERNYIETTLYGTIFARNIQRRLVSDVLL